jgi:hypothetical protein
MVSATLRRWLGATEHRRGTTAMDTEENRRKSQGHTVMTRTMRRIEGSLLGVLLMAGPAWAADFTTTAWLDWTTLTFSRVSVTVAPSQTAQMALVSGLGPGRDDAADREPLPQLGTATSIAGPTLLSASTSLRPPA